MNTLQYAAAHCNALQYTACHHKVKLGPFLIFSLVRTSNTFSDDFLFIHVTWLIRSEEKLPRTHMCDMKTYTVPFIYVTWIVWHEQHTFIHMCDMALTHSHVWHDSFTAKRCLCGGVLESGVRTGTQSGVIPLVPCWRRITLLSFDLIYFVGGTLGPGQGEPWGYSES